MTPSVYDACRDAARPVVQTLHNYRTTCIADFLSRDGRRCELCLGRKVAWSGLVHRCAEGSATSSAVKMTAMGVHNVLRTWTRRIDTFIATTEAMRATFARAGLPADRIRVKPSCAPDRGASDRERRYFCFAGRLSREKGIGELLDAWSAPGMLMDEPLGALDALTREQIQELILDLWWQTRKMFFFITHSVEEALFLATELVVMSPSPGRIAHRYKLDFGKRFIECRDARKVKSDPAFIALREDVLHLIHASAPAQEAA